MMTKIESRPDGKFALMSKDPFTGTFEHVTAWPTMTAAEEAEKRWLTGYVAKKAELDVLRVEAEARARKRDEAEAKIELAEIRARFKNAQ